mgnify:CR=1 FL=1
MILFQSKKGRVVRLEDPAAVCQTQSGGLFSISPSIDFAVEASIVTRFTMSQQVNIQFLHTMGAHVYVYVFGDRIGSISLSGLSFDCVCDGATGGAEGAFSWYKRNRASKRKEPVLVTIGNATPIEGFVTGFTEDVVDPTTNLVQWGVNIVTLPEDV